MPSGDRIVKGGKTERAVWAMAAPLAEALGLQLWDVRFLKEGATWYLRVVIDKPGGIAISDCEAMSRAIDGPLDEADPIEQSYHLQVSSPGLERELRREEHFSASLGGKIFFRLIRPAEGVRDFKGVLTACTDSGFTVTLADGSEQEIQKKETSYVKLDDFEGHA